MSTPFAAFAALCERILETSSRTAKLHHLSAWLRTLDDADYERAVRFLSTGPAVKPDARRISIGHSTLREAALLATGWDIETFRACHQAVGDTGETIGHLMAGHTRSETLSLEMADQIFTRLFTLRRTADRIELLAQTLTTFEPASIKYFVKILTGSFRIGLQTKMVEEAIAAACDMPLDAVRAASNRTGQLPQVALAARHRELANMQARLFHPLELMLAKPLEDTPEPTPLTGWIAEDKFDGIRSQIHAEFGNVKIFSRGLEDVTHSYPEIVTAIQFLGPACVLDGELLAWKNNRPLSFAQLQQRLARKKPTPKLLAEIPVVFMAYDLLYLDGTLLLDEPWHARRTRLEALFANTTLPLLLSQTHPLPAPDNQTKDNIEALFLAAKARGNEGLVLKRTASLYESGRRSGAWIKVKRSFGTLDVVITAAEHGAGKRAAVLSDYTFAIRAGDRFLNIGKAYSGLTDSEIVEITRLLRKSVIDRYGRVLAVTPTIVLEVAFDGVQKSPRHKSGFALRFPRILAWRQDKTPEQIDTLETVERLYASSVTQHD